jgi:hypothetical protein
MLTYEILNQLDFQDEMMRLMVKDEDNKEFCFAFQVDLERVMMLYDDGYIKMFIND